MRDLPVAVIGGGISGIAAAVRLIQRGRRPLLLERRAFLGGRATSFVDRETGEEIDNCQHVILGCCTNVIDLLRTLGTADELEFQRRFHYVEPGGRRHALRARPLPAPLHFLPSILGFGALSVGERLGVVTKFLRMMTMSRGSIEDAARHTMARFLEGQSERALRRFWEPILVGAVNEDLDRMTALPCLQVFLQGFLPHGNAADMGVPRLELRRLYAEPAHRFIEFGGGHVRLRANVKSIGTEGDRAASVELADGERIDVSGVIMAVPPGNVGSIAVDDGAPLVPEASIPAEFSSITGIQLWVDREVVDVPNAVLLDSPIQWVFVKAVETDRARGLGAVQRLHLVVSASRELEKLGQSEIIELARTEVARAFPSLDDARVIRGVVVKELRATISPSMEIEGARPGPETRLVNAAVAGDWTDTGWPATLEGSTRSGRIAVAHLLDEEPELTPDLPRGLLARLLLARVPKDWPRMPRP